MDPFSITTYVFSDKVDKDAKLLPNDDLVQPILDEPQNPLHTFSFIPKLLNAYSAHSYVIQHPKKAYSYLEQNSILFSLLKHLNRKVALLIPNDQQNELEKFQKQLATDLPSIANALLSQHTNHTLSGDDYKLISLQTRRNIIMFHIGNDLFQTKCYRYIHNDTEICIFVNKLNNVVDYVKTENVNAHILRILASQFSDSPLKDKVLKMKVDQLKIVAQLFNLKTKSLKKQELINNISTLIENIERIT